MALQAQPASHARASSCLLSAHEIVEHGGNLVYTKCSVVVEEGGLEATVEFTTGGAAISGGRLHEHAGHGGLDASD